MEKINHSTFEFLPEIKKFLDQKKIHDFGISEENESIHDVFSRVSSEITKIENQFSSREVTSQFKKQILDMLENQKLIPSTTILMNAGRFENAPLSACAVPPINLHEDLSEIKKSVDNFHFNGMGTGFHFDDIEDPIPLIEYLNQIGIDGQNNEKQLRPVGNMGTLSIDHPKIIEFIKLKTENENKQWVFNFSVNIPNAILEELSKKGSITLKNGQKIDTEEILDSIAESIYKTGDPGLVFIDRLNDDNQVPSAGEYESLAPCGEVGLSSGETCQFSYINLGEFVKNNKIDYEELKKTIFIAVRFLDDVVEYNISRYSNEASRNITKDKRKIGLGVCGFADLLKKLKLDYASKQANDIAENLFSYINYVSKKASVELAKERGAFGKFSESKYVTEENIIRKYSKKPTKIITENQWIELDKEIKESGIRNCATIALPPTGRSSLIIGASQSIEPYFEEMLDISPENQLLITASIQKFIDESISKTVNVNEDITVEEIKMIIKKSIALNLKGVTIYRDKSRNYQPTKLNKNIIENMENKEKYNFQYCQKIVIFSSDLKRVLLCKRKGENDYDGVYSFVGGKMESSDEDILSAMQREKNEEVGEDFKVQLYHEFSNNLTFKKKDGSNMILPHYFAKHLEGEVKLNDEYSEYKWVRIEDLEEFEPKIKNIPESVNKLLKLGKIIEDDDLDTI